MGLEAEKIGSFDVPVKQTDGGGFHDIFLWLTFHHDLPLLTCFFVFCLSLWVELFVLHLEVRVGKGLADWQLTIEVDRSSFGSK